MRLGTSMLLSLCVLSSIGYAQTVTVSGAANIFGAGSATPPPDETACAASPNGELPVEVDVPAGATSFSISNVSAPAIQCAVGSLSTSADGPCISGGPTNISASGGISGITDADDNMFITGVFLGSSDPSASPPATLDFSGDESFSSLSPALQQTFFVGDGLTGTGTGTPQHFNVPAGATRLYFGFADAYAYQGPNGCYNDNAGAATITVNFARPLATTATPSLSRSATILLALLVALAGAAVVARRRRRS